MLSEDLHLSDQELILAADGELQARRATQVQVHLAACRACRGRLAEIERTMADFARAYCHTLDPKWPPINVPRALLKAQLSELAAKSRVSSWRRFFQFSLTTQAAVTICVAFFLVGMVSKLLIQRSASRGENSAVMAVERGVVPDRNLTPGATRRVTISDVCSMPHEEVVRDVPSSLRQEIFQKYGIVTARAEDYEIDYLIAPGLGGVEDIHNLWPEPYTSRLGMRV